MRISWRSDHYSRRQTIKPCWHYVRSGNRTSHSKGITDFLVSVLINEEKTSIETGQVISEILDVFPEDSTENSTEP